MARYYPSRAAEREQEGRATISCKVTASGNLTGCSIVSESPKGAGFGSAAMQLSRLFRMSPRTVNGEATEGGTVRVPITFQLGGE